MSKWIIRENVEFLSVFKKIPITHHQYLLQFRMSEPDNPLGEKRHSINIWESNHKGQLQGVLEGTRERSYLAFVTTISMSLETRKASSLSGIVHTMDLTSF